jgi:lysine-N-methylase
MEIEDGRCPMWRQDGLCRIQAELGHGALCQTCRDFPRLRHEYGNFMERGLELSCPEAARLILNSDATLVTAEEDIPTEEPDYDEECMTILLRSRDAVLRYLEETSHTPGEALAVLLLYGHSVQAELDGGEEEAFCPESLLEEARQYAGDGDMGSLLSVLSELEMLTPTWPARLRNPAQAPLWAPELKRLAAYMVTRYWLQAVSDYDLVCRVKLAIVACLTVYALGGDLTETAQQFSKEIENNTDNMEALLDAAYTTNALTDLNLLRLLL